MQEITNKSSISKNGTLLVHKNTSDMREGTLGHIFSFDLTWEPRHGATQVVQHAAHTLEVIPSIYLW